MERYFPTKKLFAEYNNSFAKRKSDTFPQEEDTLAGFASLNNTTTTATASTENNKKIQLQEQRKKPYCFVERKIE